jgi:hypothetical protein
MYYQTFFSGGSFSATIPREVLQWWLPHWWLGAVLGMNRAAGQFIAAAERLLKAGLLTVVLM